MSKTSLRLYAAAMAVLISAVPARARQITLNEALSNAPSRFSAGFSRSADSRVYTETDGDINVAYIVSDDRGYVVLAADDVMPPVLGYSDNGYFEAANMPPAMAYWIRTYASQLAYAVSHSYEGVSKSAVPDFAPIAPLCTSRWGQDNPYNLSCPAFGGVKAPTGCTATSMAQMAYYHKWPVTGTGSNSYISESSGETMTFDFGSTTFAWNNMLDSYEGISLPVKQRAVATLMLACGNACLTDYERDSSGAYPYDAIYGLVEFMNYDKSSATISRDYYTSAQWNELVYNELANNRPVLYGGSSHDGGHAFVVDGYSSDGFYHVNWGWDGMSDGYFLLTALDPMEQGTGGSSSGYNFYQNASINLMPARENSEYAFIMYQEGNLQTNKTSYSSTESITVSAGKNYSFDFFTLTDVKVELGFNLTPESGGETFFCKGEELSFNPYYGIRNHSIPKSYGVAASSLPKSGTYIATAAFRAYGEVKDMQPKVGCVKNLRVVCTESGVEITPIAIDRTITVSDLKPASPLYGGVNCSFTANISNKGDEFYGYVAPGISRGENLAPICWLDGENLSLVDGESVNVSFSGSLVNYRTNATLSAGTYYVNLYDENDEKLSDTPVEIRIAKVPAEEAVYSITMSAGGDYSGSGTKSDPYIVEDEFICDVAIDVTQGLFDNTVYLFGYYSDDYNATDLYMYADFIADSQYPQIKTYVIDTSNYATGRAVYLRPYMYLASGWKELLKLSECIYIKRMISGISDVAADSDNNNGLLYPNPAVATATVTASAGIRSIDVFGISGSKVMSLAPNGVPMSVDMDVSGIPAGHYIVVVTTADGVNRHRLIKR